MIFVDAHSDGFFGVKFKPIKENVKRIKEVPGARFDGDKTWVIPLVSFNNFEFKFRGEIIWRTPRHILLDLPPPPPPGMYKKIPIIVPEIKPPYGLYDYQKFGASFLACIAGGTGHAILTDAVGTGKTLQSIAGGKILEQEKGIKNVLVFCKASLKYQWLRDGIERFTIDEGIVIDGDKRKRSKQYADAYDPRYKYVIVNYELLLHDLDELEKIVKTKNIGLIIADEAHKITNHKGKMNNALQKLVQPRKKPVYPGVPYIFYLTATPMASRIEQLFGIFQIRRPDFFGKFSEFSKEYLKFNFMGRASELVGYQNLDKLLQKVFPYMLRRTSNEVDMELPEMIGPLKRRVQMTALQKKLDKLALSEMERLSMELESARRNNTPDAKLEALEGQIQASMYVRKAISNTPELLTMSKSSMIQRVYGEVAKNDKEFHKSPKMDELEDLVEEIVIEGGDKMIIFTELETMTHILQANLARMGANSVSYTGKMDSFTKDQVIQEFKSNPDCHVLVATDAAAEGLNLQFCRYIVNYDLPWNPDKVTQRNGRIQRGGSQFKSVTVFDLHTEGAIDDAIVEALKNKQDLFNYMVENTAEQSQALKDVMYKK